uniref:Uncharacterized protein n=1 Tax=Bombyx mori TaxID=7091 RepID=A0A8R2M877_BOMMO|nr:ferritin isoform X17 [Bombyx mori]
MADKTSEWRPGPTVCRCCLAEGCYKDISTEYFWMGKREVYAEMLAETFSVSIAYSKSGGPNSNSRLICEPCISRLRDASDFKKQVQECEKTFMQYLDPGSSSTTLESEVQTSSTDKRVKVEQVKIERQFSDDEFDSRDFGDDDDDDDMDQPLTTFASKEPKKETVNLMELLASPQLSVKRKAPAQTKTVSVKKVKVIKKDARGKPTTSKAAQKNEDKKKKGQREAATSIWQMTVNERRNASLFLKYCTVRPFIFMGYSYKCFYCQKYFSDCVDLLQHTSGHDIDSIDVILDKYIPQGKRILQVDISKLICKLCQEYRKNLDGMREHLIETHSIEFREGFNGMAEYNLEFKDGFFNCHVCEERFHDFPLLKSHMTCHFMKVVCETCGTGFLNQHALLSHKEKHSDIRYDCRKCSKTFFKRNQLKYHNEIVHLGRARVKLKRCAHCPETFKEHYRKMLHLKQEHGITKKFKCHLCEHSFVTRRCLTEHNNKIHAQKYKCDVCSKCFVVESRLKQHLLGHTGERNYKCPICKNAYMHKITLKKHMSRSHDTNKMATASGSSLEMK